MTGSSQSNNGEDTLARRNQVIAERYNSTTSIIKIKETFDTSQFSFKKISYSEIENEIKELNGKKATTFKNIPIKLLKETSDICCSALLKIINNEIENNNFPDELKLADVTPVLKKGDATNVKNYRPVSVLPPISNLIEKPLHKQISVHFEKYLSPFLCGYRKGFSTQHAILYLIERWKSTLDNRGFGAAVLMDLSKAFDTLNHDLLIAKLEAYGFTKDALLLVHSYLTNRWQHTKINNSFSPWTELLLGVPQGSVLGPFLFNIYLNDLFLHLNESVICNYADDTTLFDSGKNLDDTIKNLEHDSLIALT